MCKSSPLVLPSTTINPGKQDKITCLKIRQFNTFWITWMSDLHCVVVLCLKDESFDMLRWDWQKVQTILFQSQVWSSTGPSMQEGHSRTAFGKWHFIMFWMLCYARCHCRGVSRTPHHPHSLAQSQISKHVSGLSLIESEGVKTSLLLLLTPSK